MNLVFETVVVVVYWPQGDNVVTFQNKQ